MHSSAPTSRPRHSRHRLPASLIVLAATLASLPAHADLGGGAPAAAPLVRDLTAEQRPVAQFQVPASDLTVNAWVNQADNSYKPGEFLELTVQTNKEAYITVVDVGTSGKVHIVYPNQFQTDNRVRPNKPVRIPSGGDDFALKVGGPAGTEVLKIIATTSPQPLFPAGQLASAGPFKAYKGGGAAAAKDLETVLRQNAAGNAWAEYTKIIRIADGTPTAAAPAPVQPAAAGGPVPPAAVAVVPAAPAPGSGFKLSVATDKPVYKVGEAAMVSVASERDCRLTLVDVGSSGTVHVLYPNRHQPDNRLKAGQPVTIPSAATPVDFRVQGPDGLEALVAICRSDDQPVLSGTLNYQQSVFPAYGDAKALAKDLAATLRQPSAAIAHATTSFLVSAP
ncbi:DUF4384 domain-containing protein [Azospirillum agricola]|uniref:DUF4384 domain-containing protein n=1 Tax=Azospirillum agricola TaxID=1720247 RepID=UPI000A0F18E6|nr:DUF4384 domain-containing protein [Azospirillum agricola]SMH31934.1 protein of unknown function [Azospirillum lipoferum]